MDKEKGIDNITDINIMSFVYSGLVTRQKRMFARLILDVAYGFFLPPFGFQIRVGALYLLYSLYGCQTAEPRETVGNAACALWTSSTGSCLM